VIELADAGHHSAGVPLFVVTLVFVGKIGQEEANFSSTLHFVFE